MSDENNSDDDVIKVKRTHTNPALLTQLQHSRQFRQARGLGAGHTGAGIWLTQRLTALALVPLAVWFAVSMVRLTQGTQAAAVDWLAFPINAVLMALFIVIALRHAVIGLKIVLEDYVDSVTVRTVSVVLINAGAIILAAASIAALVRLVAT